MVRQSFGCIFLPQQIQHGEEFEKTSGPAVVEDERDSIFLGGEEGDEVESLRVSEIILDVCGEIGETVDVVFGFSPVEFVEPVLFGIDEPVSWEAYMMWLYITSSSEVS